MILACAALCCAAVVGAAAPKQVARPTNTEATANSVLFILSSPKASAVQRRRSPARMDLPEMYGSWNSSRRADCTEVGAEARSGSQAEVGIDPALGPLRP